jgi:hypothetical protein
MEADEKLEDTLLDVHGLDCLDCEPVREEIRAHIRTHYVPLETVHDVVWAMLAWVPLYQRTHSLSPSVEETKQRLDAVLSEYGYSETRDDAYHRAMDEIHGGGEGDAD